MDKCKKAYFDIDNEYRYSWNQVSKAMKENEAYAEVRESHLKFDNNDRCDCTDEEVIIYDESYIEGFDRGCQSVIQTHNIMLLKDSGEGKIINLNAITSEVPYEGFYDDFFLSELGSIKFLFDRMEERLKDQPEFWEKLRELYQESICFEKYGNTDDEKIIEHGYEEGYKTGYKYMSLKISQVYMKYIDTEVIAEQL